MMFPFLGLLGKSGGDGQRGQRSIEKRLFVANLTSHVGFFGAEATASGSGRTYVLSEDI